ncbi:MAG: hypothetical protein ACREMW_09315 [Gemmatimonadales bacterium]
MVAGLILAAWPTPSIHAQSTLLVDIRNLTPQEHRSAAFVLPAPQALHLEATGAEPRRDRRREFWNWGNEDERTTWPAAAWIIDVRTRNVVWDLRTAETDRSREGLRRFAGTIQLPAGVYEAHYGSFAATSVTHTGNLDSFISRSRDRRRQGEVRYSGPYVDDGSYRAFAFAIRGEGRPAQKEDLDSATRAFTGSVVLALLPENPGTSERTGFELARPTDVEVYAIGELQRNGAYDYGWIQNADTRRRVWEMEYARTAPAGGAHKNRMVRDIIRLAAGRYVAYFVSDDSHDPDQWNAVPPYDPDFWGLTLRVAAPAARAGVRAFEWEPVPARTIVSLTGMGDDELRSEGFTLRRPMDVRLYALGEGSNPDGEMDDYAWIVDASTRRRVWAMEYGNTEGAGGADKNRLFYGSIRLEAGSYLVYYKSDGSHSAGKWNASPPAESRYWGISVFPASGRLDPSAVGPLERAPSSAIAQLIRIRSDKRKHTLFTLERPTTARIYAIGEAVGDEMADYGWIEDAASGDTVWEMTYRATSPAGGAQKNRVFDGTVRLAAGRYVLHYQTDGSHAYRDWNDDPPDDPEGWGVAVLRVP